MVATLALAAVIHISKVPLKFMMRGLKSILILLMITVVFNLFLIPGTPVLHLWKLTVTKEDKIMKAQMARGADFESGNLIQKAKNMVPLLVPLFISAFRRANDLAMAMEARGYHGGEGRTKMKPLVYASRDKAAYAVMAGYLIVMFAASRIMIFGF